MLSATPRIPAITGTTPVATAVKKGIYTEEGDTYRETGGTCSLSSCTVGLPRGGVVGSMDVARDIEQALMSASGHQPMSIAKRINPRFNSSGVLTASCGANIDHGVLAVEYGTDAGSHYWKAKNSW